MAQIPSPPLRPIRKKSRALRNWLFAFCLLVGAVGGEYKWTHRGEMPVSVTIEPAVVKTIVQTVSATGKIQPEVEVKIAPEVSGEIVALPFREGASVKKGDLILKIKPDNYQFQVDQEKAGVDSALASEADMKARLEKADEDYQRNKALHEHKPAPLISDADFTTARIDDSSAKAAYENAKANVTHAQGALQQMQDQLDKTTIFSPIDGTVSSLSNELGETIAGTGQYGGAEVLRVADLTNMELRVNINENDIVNVKPGDKAVVSIDAFPHRKFNAMVKDIAAAAKTSGSGTQDEVTNFLVKIRILDKDEPLKPGMSASAEVETQTVQNVVAVPIQSVTVRTRDTAKTIDEAAAARDKLAKDNQGEGAAAALSEKQQKEQEKADRDSFDRVVFIYQDGKVRQAKVETGIADTTLIEIKSGLKAGDQVVSGSFTAITRTLKDGMAVAISPPPGAPVK